MKQIERIRYFEEQMDRIAAASAALDKALEEFRAVQPLAKELEEYYVGEDWRTDFEDDEAGKLPKDLKRGVLSEDAAYDTLEENRELLIRLLETAAAALRD